MSKDSVSILKKAADNLKGEAVVLQEKIKENEDTVRLQKTQLSNLVGRVEQLEKDVIALEKKDVGSKSKKVK